MAVQDFFENIFQTGADAYVDSQRSDRVKVNNPIPRTQDGRAGEAQPTSYADVLSSPLAVGGMVLLGVLLIALIVRK